MKITLLKPLIITAMVLILGLSIGNALYKTELHDVKVEKLINQQLITGAGSERVNTEYRYLIVTNKGTFICRSSWVNLKFDNSDLFFHLKEGQTYRSFVVAGIGKSPITDYSNLISFTE